MKTLPFTAIMALMLISLTASANELILWNKLGSADEVKNSAIGPDGEIIGDILFQPAQHGNGYRSALRTGDHNIPTNYVRFPIPRLGPKGTVEFWYHPDWRDGTVGHVIDLVNYGSPESASPLLQRLQFNDWQNRGAVVGLDVGQINGAAEYFNPSTDPQWSTVAPIHIAYTWDSTATKKVFFFINGIESGSDYFSSGIVDFAWPSDNQRYLAVGSRMYSGDWDRHPWEPNIDGIIDNLKVWDFAKTDFSDRFVDRPTSKEQCFNGIWKAFDFKNQGQCIAAVNEHKKKHKDDDKNDSESHENDRKHSGH